MRDQVLMTLLPGSSHAWSSRPLNFWDVQANKFLLNFVFCFLILTIHWRIMYTSIYNKWQNVFQTLLLAYSENILPFKTEFWLWPDFHLPPGGLILPGSWIWVPGSAWRKESWWGWANHSDPDTFPWLVWALSCDALWSDNRKNLLSASGKGFSH